MGKGALVVFGIGSEDPEASCCFAWVGRNTSPTNPFGSADPKAAYCFEECSGMMPARYASSS